MHLENSIIRFVMRKLPFTYESIASAIIFGTDKDKALAIIVNTISMLTKRTYLFSKLKMFDGVFSLSFITVIFFKVINFPKSL